MAADATAGVTTPRFAFGAVFLALVALLAGANVWLFTSYLEPSRDRPGPDFLFQLRPVGELIGWTAGMLIGLTALYLIWARRQPSVATWVDALEWRHISHLSTLLLLGLPLLAVGMLATPLRPHAPPWLFLFVDLRWWFFAAVFLLQAIAVHAASERRWSRRVAARVTELSSRPASQLWLEVGLVAVLAVAAMASSPQLRFHSNLIGDEPKYIRFAENWYRGRGLDITGLGAIDERAASSQADPIANVRRLGSEVPIIAADLLADAGRAVGLSVPRPPRAATKSEEWFVRGKRSGVYQVHNPGFSVLLFPAYFVDRHFLNWTHGLNSQFPDQLYATNLTVLILYLLWGVALFRLLSAYTGDTIISWLLTLAAMSSLPATAFNYQYYPEAAAGLVITALARYVTLSADTRPGGALFYGFLAGYLPWLHLRFGLAAMVAAVAYSVIRRHAPRAVIAFWAGLMVPLAAMGLYYYHISGSLRPWALYDLVTVSPGLSGVRMLYGLSRSWFDWRAGLIAHAPIYLLALPGLLPFWRRRPSVGVPIFLLVLSVAALAAAHNWHGAGTTPGRLIAAVVPLLMLPLSDALATYGRSRWFVVLVAVLAVISVQNGLTYNLHLDRADQGLVGPSVSGWKTPLLLPNGNKVTAAINPLFVVWVAATALLIALPLLRSSLSRLSKLLRFRAAQDREAAPRRAPPWSVVVAIVLVAVATAGSAAGAFNGRTLYGGYMASSKNIRSGLLRAYLVHGGTTWSAQGGRVDPARLFPNPDESRLYFAPAELNADAREPFNLRIEARGRNEEEAWGVATINFGDGAGVEHTPMVGAATVQHRYAKGGEYPLQIELALSGLPPLRRSETVHVASRDAAGVSDSADFVQGLPPNLMKAPPSLVIETIAIGESGVELRCVLPWRVGEDGFWVWMSAGQSRLYSARRTAVGDDGRMTLTFTTDPRPGDGELVGIMAGLTSPGSRKGTTVRSRGVPVRWPASSLTRGAPVVFTPIEAAR